MKIKNQLIPMVLLATLPGLAQVQKVDIKKDLPANEVADLFQAAGKKNKSLSSLAQIKDHEIHLRWSECLQLAPKVFNTHKEVRGWVAQTWLNCLSSAQKRKVDLNAVHKVLTTLEGHKELFQQGPWAWDLRLRWVEMRMDSFARMSQRNIHSLENLLAEEYRLSREQKSQIYQWLAEMSLGKGHYDEAKFLFEEAQDLKDSDFIQEKLTFIAKLQGRALSPRSPNEKVEYGGEELKIEERARQSLKQNNYGAALKDILLILNEYSGSRSAKRLKDKPLEIYNGTSEKIAKIKTLDEMQEADASRLLEWAQSLHRRGDYSGALVLAQRAVQKGPASPQVVNALWVAGRSAHFLGQYSKALDFYNKLSTYHSGSDEAAEALFRSALIHYRQQEYSSAVALLEKVLQTGRDRYDLSAQYWLVRSLQETNVERSKQVAEKLIERYPFSYYGLRLRAEANGGFLQWPTVSEKAPALQHEIFLVGDQKKTWQRFKELSAAGWLTEAQAEIADFPAIKEASLKVQLAVKLSERQQYMAAIRLINEALELDPQLRREEFVKVSYPTAFASLYQVEAERYGVHASLLQALTRQESAFNIKAVSSSQALGLMQMIPPTAQEVAKKLGLKIEIPGDMFRPEVNIPMGSFYIAQMLGQFENNVPFALAAYNAGPHRMNTWLEGRSEVKNLVSQASGAPRDEVWFDELPWNETSFYVKAILRNILLYRLATEGPFTVKPVLWQDLQNKKAK